VKLSWAARRRWALVLLLVGLPLYVAAAVTAVNRLDRPPLVVELAVYVALGIVWVLPFRFLFLGIGRPDPDAPREGSDQRVLGDGAPGTPPYSDDRRA
jgi:hypothetical protein